MSGLASKCPKQDKSTTFLDHFKYILARQAILNLILKSSRFVTFRTYVTQFGAKPDIPGADIIRVHGCQIVTLCCQFEINIMTLLL